MAGMGLHLATGSVVWEAMADRRPQADQIFLDITNAPPRAVL